MPIIAASSTATPEEFTSVDAMVERLSPPPEAREEIATMMPGDRVTYSTDDGAEIEIICRSA